MSPIELLQDSLVDQEAGLKELLTWFLNLAMQLEASQQTRAELHPKIDGRKAYRNRDKKRSLMTSIRIVLSMSLMLGELGRAFTFALPARRIF